VVDIPSIKEAIDHNPDANLTRGRQRIHRS